MTLYLKYRPQSLAELDLNSVRESLSKIMGSAKIPHAFLFSGPKGTGKTSAARIIAKIFNCEARKAPCNKCKQCKAINKGVNLDVIEIDAASHRGIDDIRTLREAVKLAPAQAKKKVYIIDEAQMLTLEASNALLKTLEEPPAHVIFILATTNPEKLIGTIRSRVTEIVFPKPSLAEISRSLLRVSKGERIKVFPEALELIALAAKGSFRDATKIFEQVIGQKISLKADNLEKYLHGAIRGQAEDFLRPLIKKDAKAAINQIEKIADEGSAMIDFCQDVLQKLRTALLAKVGIGGEDIAALTKGDLLCLIELFSRAAAQIGQNPIEQLPLELAVVRWCDSKIKNQESNVKNKIPANPQPVTSKTPTKLSVVTDDVWRTILAQIRPINTSIEALLRAARPVDFDGRVLTLAVYYRFHKERLEEQSHRRVLEDVVGQVIGNPVRIVCTLSEPPVKVVVQPPAQSGVLASIDGVLTESEDKDIIKIAEEIFGNV